MDELIDLLSLQAVVIIGRCKLQTHVVMLISAHNKFVVQLITPYIFRALRYTNNISPLVISRTSGEENGKKGDPNILSHIRF